MIALRHEAECWLKHIAGESRLPYELGIQSINEAVELNKNGEQIVSSFGNQTFEAVVGFVDMRGFSEAATGKSPQQVKEIADPFVSAVIAAACNEDCFIDKTIGDEVMFIMPRFGRDAELSDLRLATRNLLLVDATALLHRIMRETEKFSSPYQLSAGMAFGSVLLTRVGIEAYSEWTVYGNTVNAAKRLQSRAGQSAQSDAHLLAVGAISSEQPTFREELHCWLKQIVPAGGGPLLFDNTDILVEPMKGVGEVVFVSSVVSSRPDCL